MKILFVSDVHFENQVFHGVDESRAWNWLISIIDFHRPDLVLSAGDLGTAVTVEHVDEVLKRCKFYTIYGNHDNVEVLEKTNILLKDGEVININGLNIVGINGIISLWTPVKGSVPRKPPHVFLDIAKKVYEKYGNSIDILLIHEVPNLPIYRGVLQMDWTKDVVREVVEIVKPKVCLNGHVHRIPYTYYKWKGIHYLRVESSQFQKCYAIIYWDKKMIEIWKDKDKITTITM